MKSHLKGVLALAVMLGMSLPAFAEVQNVKVSGDITTRSFYKANYDLKDATKGNVANGTADDTSFSATFTHVGINADLTDNVSTEVGLANQRLWAFEGTTAGAGDVDIYSAYVTLKEFFYSPLTVKVGLQPLLFGHGFIVGPGPLNDPSGGISSGTYGNVGFQGAREFSILNSYDAIVATLDLEPWKIDAVAMKHNETVRNNNDKTMYGLNVGHQFSSYNALAEAYWFSMDDEGWNQTLRNNPSDTALTQRNFEENEVHVIGIRGSVEPISRLNLRGEFGYQFGEIRDDEQDGGPSPAQAAYPFTRDRKAWAMDLLGEYAFDTVYSPTLGVGWVTYSGEEADALGVDGNGDYQAWDPMVPSAYYGLIQSNFGGFDGSNIYGTQDPNDTVSLSNRHLLRVLAGAKPMDSLKLNVEWIRAWFEEKPVAGRDDHAGDEVDVTLTYNYTEDVTLGLAGGWFLPGKYYDGETTVANRSNDAATLAMGTVSVVF